MNKCQTKDLSQLNLTQIAKQVRTC